MASKYSFEIENDFELGIVLCLSIVIFLLAIPSTLGLYVATQYMSWPMMWWSPLCALMIVALFVVTLCCIAIPAYFFSVCRWYVKNRHGGK